MDLYQTQSLFQDPDLIFCEPEPIPINGQRAIGPSTPELLVLLNVVRLHTSHDVVQIGDPAKLTPV